MLEEVGHGETIKEAIKEAIAGLREATRLYLEEFPLPETSPRYMTSIEVSYAYVATNLREGGDSSVGEARV